MLFCCCSSDHEVEPTTQKDKKEYVFTNKKDAIEAFKTLLREKVGYFKLTAFILLMLYLASLNII